MKIENNTLIEVTEADLVDGVFVNNSITAIADKCFYDMPSLKKVVCENVEKIGSDCFSYNAALMEVTLPVLAQCGSDCFRYNAALMEVTLPVLAQCGSYCFSYNAALMEVTLPVLAQCGSYCFRYNAALKEVTLPVLAQCGSYCFRYNAALTEVSIGNKKYAVKNVDGDCFVIANSKTSRGIKIYTGYVLLGIKEKKHIKQECFVAEKDGFTAHGETVKKAVSDCQFKIIAEKLRKEPINADTLITVNHYRLVTGACELGVNRWMQENNLTELTEMRADELLPILEKTNAYGVSQFKQLVNF